MTVLELRQIQLRQGTAAQWTASNPTLAIGEPGFENDTGKLKIGDGTHTWTALKYQPAPPLASGTVTLTAGSSGLIANTSITANSIVKAWNVSAAGTVGALSIVLSAGAGFTIQSSSATDTSHVYYEVVSY